MNNFLPLQELYTCTFSLAEGIAELYQERKNQQEVEHFRTAHCTILTDYWESFVCFFSLCFYFKISFYLFILGIYARDLFTNTMFFDNLMKDMMML